MSYKRYILYFIAILVLLIIGGNLTNNYYNTLVSSNDLNFIKQTLINLLSYGGVGIVLGIENLIKENKKDGKWKFDYTKMIIAGIPTFLLSLPFVWAAIIIIFLDGKVDNIIMTIYNLITIFNIVFGYICISCIYREEEKCILEFRNLIKLR